MRLGLFWKTEIRKELIKRVGWVQGVFVVVFVFVPRKRRDVCFFLFLV